MLKEKLEGSDLQEIAKSNNTNLRNANGVTLKSPTLSKIGFPVMVGMALVNITNPNIANEAQMDKKIKILTLSDMPLSPSGVGTQTKYMIEALLATGVVL